MIKPAHVAVFLLAVVCGVLAAMVFGSHALEPAADASNIPQPYVDPRLYIAPSLIPGAGRGVFARRAIRKEETIERSAGLNVPNEGILNNYVFSKPRGNSSFLAFGYGSLYNHADSPNVAYAFNDARDMLEFTAVKDIAPHEELYINYGSTWFSSRGMQAHRPLA